jgi:hypothetical protein
MDNVERFENDMPTIKNIFANERRQPITSDAAYDTPNLAAADGSSPLGNIYASDPSSVEYSSTTGETPMQDCREWICKTRSRRNPGTTASNHS